jgi:DNA replication protein DnaC
VWYAQKMVELLPRLRGRGKHRIDYRHVIDWLVRKPGAFADYRYRADLFPSSHFRMAYDVLRQQQPARSDKEYLRILHLAARESEAGVEAALVELLKEDSRMDAAAVRERLRQQGQVQQATDVTVAAVDLSLYDALLDGKEAEDGEGRGREDEAGSVSEGTASASLPEELARQAQQEGLSFEQYLLGLVQRECQERRNKRVERLLHESRLPLEKSWSALDLKRLPAKVVQQARTLLEGSFLDRAENVLVFGPPGSGKTHVLSAVSQELVRSGRRVLSRKCGLLVQELLLAKRDLKLPALLKRLAGYEALLVDDLGYVQQSREEMEVLFTLLAERYERGSVLLTSNLPFSGWEAIFKDPMTTAAAIDRLVHHSVIIELNLPSYRAEQAKKAKQARQAETGESSSGPGTAKP